MRCILKEGMPLYRNPFEKGRLVVRFSIRFPSDDWMSPEKYVELEKYLPTRQEVIIPDVAEDCVLHKVNPGANGAGGHRREVYDEGDDDEAGGRRVECATH